VLIASPRHTTEDLAAWQSTQRTAETHAQINAFKRHVQRSRDALLSFTGAGTGYAGVSWGKDSVVIAALIADLVPRWPLVWVRVEPIVNPDCDAVRDEFMRTHPGVRYEEIAVWCTRDADGWHASGTLETGFSRAAAKHGDRYVSGIRADESGIRKLRVAKHGLASRNTCAPIGWWTAWDVFAFLESRGLPVHPAYACTMGGLLDPGRIRVASLGGKRGDGMGRREWEERYYREELRRLSTNRPANPA
jgi:phosphoadenosine phosphosulfate reductase